MGPPLARVLATLKELYAPPAPPADPFEHVMWDNIGYLIDDDRRRRLFDRFANEIGLDPAAIAGAADDRLMAIAAAGGMRPEMRVTRWRAIAALVLGPAAGDLGAALRDLPLAKARTLLKRFPTIADPAADRILLFAGVAPLPALESNGLRVLARLGLCEEGVSYPISYRAGIAALKAGGPADADGLRQAYLLLRAHGQALCKRGAPLCVACPLSEPCPKVAVQAL